MNCEQYSEWISRSLDGELGPEEEAQLREHLASCATCARFEGEQRRLDAALKAMPAPAAPRELPMRLREAVAREKSLAPRNARLGFRYFAIAAIVALSVFVVVLSMQVRALKNQRTASPEQVSEMPPVTNNARMALLSGNIDEQVKAFQMTREYLEHGVRWMAVDGNQVELGVSGNGASRTSAGADEKLIVLAFQYLQRRSNGETTALSEPQFVLLPGEEASVRLAGKETSHGLYRYRVNAEFDERGDIAVHVAFSRDNGNGAPVSTSIKLKEGGSALLWASGDAAMREELYVGATVRKGGLNHAPSKSKADVL